MLKVLLWQQLLKQHPKAQLMYILSALTYAEDLVEFQRGLMTRGD